MGYFDNLKLDTWFKAVTYLGGIIMVLSLTVPIRVISNEVMAGIGFGMFIYGVGRWKNRKTVTQITRSAKISQEKRIPDLLGLFLEVSGVLLVAATIGYVVYANVASVL